MSDGGFAGRWRALNPAVRWGGGLLVSLMVLELILVAAGYATGGSGPEGPPLSSYATSRGGLAAYAELLRDRGHEVIRLRTRLDDAGLDAAATVVLLGPDRVTAAEIGALRDFLVDGGRVVAGGPDPAWLPRLIPDAPAWSPAGAPLAVPLAPVEEVASVSRVRTAGRGSWNGGGALPLLAGDRTVASVASARAGRVVLLADASMLSNRWLDAADNAAFGLAAAGPGRPVLFAEAAHGFGPATGLRALPVRWRTALVGLAGAAVVWMWAMGRRLGPPETARRSPPPPRHAFVDAQAINLARARAPEEAIAPLKAAARSRLRRRGGLPPSADEPALRSVAERLGLTEEEAAALVEPVSSDAQVLAAGRAAAKLAGATHQQGPAA